MANCAAISRATYGPGIEGIALLRCAPKPSNRYCVILFNAFSFGVHYPEGRGIGMRFLIPVHLKDIDDLASPDYSSGRGFGVAAVV